MEVTTMESIFSVANILIILLGAAVKFIYSTLEKADKDLRDQCFQRIDKLEENSRRDDETVKELIKEAENRMTVEISARITNIVELHKKTEKIYDALLNKNERLLDRLSNLEGKNEVK